MVNFFFSKKLKKRRKSAEDNNKVRFNTIWTLFPKTFERRFDDDRENRATGKKVSLFSTFLNFFSFFFFLLIRFGRFAVNLMPLKKVFHVS